MYACLLAAIYRKACLHFNITKIELMYSVSWWVKSAVSVTYLELRRLKLKYTWQLTPCLLQIIDGRLSTGSTNQVSITTVVEVPSGKGHA